ncbi:hypothetical protein NDU88_005273 [Pleurodeles waltl]|uniref:Uncharacterized protein n=1 Tax=Pleurodeles waltl TaxID=8319 RepID=A0AAV7QF72_PLEWA|nr:hypothetical protein NDU88_005273 [Pleurodeles waltl]
MEACSTVGAARVRRAPLGVPPLSCNSLFVEEAAHRRFQLQCWTRYKWWGGARPQRRPPLNHHGCRAFPHVQPLAAGLTFDLRAPLCWSSARRDPAPRQAATSARRAVRSHLTAHSAGKESQSSDLLSIRNPRDPTHSSRLLRKDPAVVWHQAQPPATSGPTPTCRPKIVLRSGSSRRRLRTAGAAVRWSQGTRTMSCADI